LTPLEDLLQQCTVKITVPGGWGTGFFVAPELILTCAHVVRKATDSQVTISSPVWQQHLSAIVKAKADDGKTLDLALVKLSEPLPDHACVLLGEKPVAIGQALYSYGYLESYTNAAPVRPVNEGLTGDMPPLLKLQGAQIEKGISGAALLNLKTGKVCGIVKETRAAGFDLGGGAIPTRVVLEQFPELRSLQQTFHGGDRRWVNLITTQPGIDFQPYLQAILANDDYRAGQEVYTPTTVEDRRRMPEQDSAIASQRRFSLRLKLRVETVKPDKQEQSDQRDGPEQVEQWDVLAGLRNYAADHVVLIGKPGSGKSTSLERLLLEEAEKALQDPNARIPVLVKLRRCTGTIERTIERRIQDFLFLDGHGVALEIAQIESLLRQGKFLALLDGLNELPKAFETEIANFRDRYRRTTPMIVSTRDLGGGGTLGIKKTLKMLPLTEPQMREFVRRYLEEKGDRLFQQLQGDRLRKFAETPLLLWMLCRVFAHNGKVPDNLGLAFREFAQLHDQELQADAPVDSKDQWHKLLRHLAFVMMQGKTLIDPELSIPREEAEDCLTAYLRQEDRPNPRGCAEQWLKDLLKYHLIQPVIQPNFEEHVEFCHQLIQEYYAAEYLLRLLPNLTDDQLKQDYLNYLKWTEPVALMLSMVEEEAQALRVVKLAMDGVDLILGARLAGEVKPIWQATTVGWIDAKELPIQIKVQCWEFSRSEHPVDGLLAALADQNASVRRIAAEALGKIGSDRAINSLLTALTDPDAHVCQNAADSLGEIGSKCAIDALLIALKYGGSWVSGIAAGRLVKIGHEYVIDELLVALKDVDPEVRSRAAAALGRIGSERVIDDLLTALKDTNSWVRRSAASALGRIGSERTTDSLLILLKDTDPDIRWSAARGLGKIGSEDMIDDWLTALKDMNDQVRGIAAKALVKIGSARVIDGFLVALKDLDPNVRISAAAALGRIGSEHAIDGLLTALKDPNRSVRWSAARALGKIGNDQTIDSLLIVLKDTDSSVRSSALEALGDIDNECVIDHALAALKEINYQDRGIAVEVLVKIGSEQVIDGLLIALRDPNPKVRDSAAAALVVL